MLLWLIWQRTSSLLVRLLLQPVVISSFLLLLLLSFHPNQQFVSTFSYHIRSFATTQIRSSAASIVTRPGSIITTTTAIFPSVRWQQRSSTRYFATSDRIHPRHINHHNNRSTPITMTESTPTLHTLPGNPSWQQTMIRIRDPQRSLHFYTTILNMTHIDTLHFPQYQFSIYFVTTVPPELLPYPHTPGSPEARDFLWNYHGTTIELTHNHGTEVVPIPESNDDATTTPQNSTPTPFTGYHPGNQDPRDGFGHLAIAVDDVEATCQILEHEHHCTFAKKPNEGRMKGLAFVHDPDQYWIEILARGPLLQQQQQQQSLLKPSVPEDTIDCNLCQTMLRIKDPKKSIPFYLSFGMKLLQTRHFDTFSLYFLGSGTMVPDHEEEEEIQNRFHPVLELTHNHGTELDPNFRHYHGNEADRSGFGHLGFLVDDVYDFCRVYQTHFPEYGFRKEPDAGSMKGLAFVYDPDGYSIEIIKRGGIDFGDVKEF